MALLEGRRFRADAPWPANGSDYETVGSGASKVPLSPANGAQA